MSQTKAQLVSGTTAQDLTVDNINTTSINSGQPSGRRNLIINGAMQVAQRGTSSTDQNYGSLDRFKIIYSGTDEAPTHSQVDVAAGQTPYTLGFRKAYRITNGNQTSGAQSSSRIELQTNLEGQDLAQSGWNFVSSSSNITLSFWIKSSVAQTFASRLQTQTAGANGSQQRFKFNFALSADTWTKVTKTIPGNANLAFATDNQNGFRISFFGFMGTTFTDSTTATDVWADNTGGDRADDMTSTWFTTNDATLEITGVQLEVGSTATDFEFRSFGEELALCQRYFQSIGKDGTNAALAAGFTTTNTFFGYGCLPGGEMRTAPTIAVAGTLSHLGYTQTAVAAAASSLTGIGTGKKTFSLQIGSSTGTTNLSGAYARMTDAASALTFSAEL